MTTQEMKKKLIELYNAKQSTKSSKYAKKLGGMVSGQVQQEYDLIVLGKEYKPKKKSKSKNGLGVKLEESRIKEDVKDVW